MKRIKQTHALKLDMHFANAVKRGDKCFEIRKNDRGFQQGDTVVFQVVNKEGRAAYPRPELSPLYGKVYEITYVLNGYGLKEDYVVFGIKEIPLVTLDGGRRTDDTEAD